MGRRLDASGLMSPNILRSVEDAFARLESWKGRLVSVEELVSRCVGKTWSYDRHFSTRTEFSLVVESVDWQFSGSSLELRGSQGGRPASYQITMDCLVEVESSDSGSVAFKERFGRAAERCSAFRLVGGA
jgi:hypothetical protein